MKTIIWEHETSEPEVRHIPLAHAQALGERGGFYRVQIIDELNDAIVYEYKADTAPRRMTLADWRIKKIGAYWYAINVDGTEYIAPSKAELMRKINRH